MTTEGGEGGGGVDARKLVLYKSFNTPCVSTRIVYSWRYKGFPSAQQKQHIQCIHPHVKDIIDARRRIEGERKRKSYNLELLPVLYELMEAGEGWWWKEMENSIFSRGF
jgi:hypothetical protein